MTKNFPNLVEEKDTQVWEEQRFPNKMNLKRPTIRHIIIKMAKVKDKERILKAAKKRELTTRELPLDCQLISQQKYFRPEEIGMKY